MVSRTQLSKKVSLDTIASLLQDERRAQGSFSPTWLEDLIHLLALTELPESIPQPAAIAIARTAVFEVAKRNAPITPKTIRVAIRRKRDAFCNQATRPFILVSALSIRRNPLLPRTVRINDVTITFTPSLPRRFDRSHVAHHPASAPSDYLAVRAAVRARSVADAFHRCAEAIDFVVGLWNFSLLRGRWSQSVDDDSRPLADVSWGPTHSLHSPDGSTATSSFWYEPCFPCRPALRINPTDSKRLVSEANKVRKLIRRAHSPGQVVALFVRYSRAVTDPSAGAAIMQLWGLLESMTDTGARYDETIARVANSLHPREPVRLLLELLRFRRNRLAHVGDAGVDGRRDAVRLQFLVSHMLEFVVTSSRLFRNLGEVGHFLSLPTDEHELRRSVQLRNEALRFHHDV